MGHLHFAQFKFSGSTDGEAAQCGELYTKWQPDVTGWRLLFGARPSEWLHVDGGVAHSTVRLPVPVRPGVAPPALRLAAASYYQTGGCPELSLENILEQSTAEAAMKAPLIDCIVSGN